MAARIQVPTNAKTGDVIEIRILIQHPMETGYRVDDTGRNIPRNTIRSFACTYNGEEIFRADLSSGVSANPYLQFTTVAQGSGVIACTWIDDTGKQESEQHPIQVAG
ncbi:MAG: thiosulfate oxidation carrier complex protein SoxZ [Burkholderiales bacterium]